jgi:hypothetical protein
VSYACVNWQMVSELQSVRTADFLLQLSFQPFGWPSSTQTIFSELGKHIVGVHGLYVWPMVSSILLLLPM